MHTKLRCTKLQTQIGVTHCLQEGGEKPSIAWNMKILIESVYAETDKLSNYPTSVNEKLIEVFNEVETLDTAISSLENFIMFMLLMVRLYTLKGVIIFMRQSSRWNLGGGSGSPFKQDYDKLNLDWAAIE